MDLGFSLKNIWRRWRKFWETISLIITKLLLGILYYTIFTLYRSVAKALRKDFLDLEMVESDATYWKGKEKKEEENYKQY